MIRCDDYVDMNTADANNTTLTATILQNGTHGADAANWAVTGTGLQIGASRIRHWDLTKVNGTGGAYGINNKTRCIQQANADSSSVASLTVGGSAYSACTAACYYTPGHPNNGTGSTLSAVFQIFNGNGDFAVLQLNNGGGLANGPYYLNIETDASGTLHFGQMRLNPSGTYWVCLKADWTGSKAYAQAAVYTPTYPFQRLGYCVGALATPGQVITTVKVGNNQGDTPDTGSTTFWENIVVDYKSAAFPILPSVPLFMLSPNRFKGASGAVVDTGEWMNRSVIPRLTWSTSNIGY